MKQIVTLLSVLCMWLAYGVVSVTQAQTERGMTSQAIVTEVLNPDYVSPVELVEFLGTTTREGTIYFFCDLQNQSRPVQIRYNDASNVLMLTGAPEDVAQVKELIKSADIPPRQIVIETQIIELDQKKLDDLGIDWEDLLRSSGINIAHAYAKNKAESEQESYGQRHVVSLRKVRGLPKSPLVSPLLNS